MSRLPRTAAGAGGFTSAGGFTIVELIAVILLLGVLSMVAISRSVGPNAFRPGIVTGFLIDEVRFARRIAANRQDVDISVRLTLNADEWLTEVLAGGATPLRSRTLERRGITLLLGVATLDTGDTLVLSYDGRGELLDAQHSGTPVAFSNGLELLVVGETTRTLCVYPSGYATDAACV